jgi:high-affinity iron transporter
VIKRNGLGVWRRAAVVVASITTAASAVVTIGSPHADAASVPVITVSTRSCAPGWTAPSTGRRTFTVRNISKELFDVELVGADQVTVYGDLEKVGPRTTVDLTTTVPPGTYRWRCAGISGTETISAPARVTGRSGQAAHPYVPVTYDQLQAVTLAYRTAVTAGLARLSTDTDQLQVAVDSGNLAQAEALWLVAHMQYERLGAAYGTFGDFDTEIDGRPQGLAGGINDPKFQGFLRLEYGLWNGQLPSELVPVADALDAAVHGLDQGFPLQQTPPNDVALRTHEILENSLQFELTGETDEGSHTNLATVRANVDGTMMTLQAVTPLLRQRNPALLRQVTTGLAQLATLLDRYQHPDGTWVALDSLTQAQREQLDGAVSELVEQLAPIADILELPQDAASE